MVKKLAAKTGSGWKGYTAGIGLMLYAIVVMLDATAAPDILPESSTLDEAFRFFMDGLGIFGIRAAVSSAVDTFNGLNPYSNN